MLSTVTLNLIQGLSSTGIAGQARNDEKDSYNANDSRLYKIHPYGRMNGVRNDAEWPAMTGVFVQRTDIWYFSYFTVFLPKIVDISVII